MFSLDKFKNKNQVTRADENYAIIGLGKFGGALCKQLAAENQEILAIDTKEKLVNRYMNIANKAVIADAQDEEALRKLNIEAFDHVFITIGSDIQASVLSALNCKDLGVKDLICKAQDRSHARILERIGADQIVQPESDMAKRIVMHHRQPHIIDYLDLSEDVTLAEVEVNNKEYTERTLGELSLRNNFDVNVIAIIQKDHVDVYPDARSIIHHKDMLAVIGSVDAVNNFDQEFNEN
ncbi:KtrA protein [Ligilactobacillus acidipiscis DSM 15836]|uniref:KtrA protein n=1 Tax=Ligilactobacillus acidipiscis DSM 15836 TaxID=1423716 RepID=A0ABR5PM30_9LACO|nr:KtrA protein [Ligilactobacillus acidipiscis DSM 15836]